MSSFNIDHQRDERLGFPEIIYGKSKDIGSLKRILLDYKAKYKNALITKLQKEKAEVLSTEFEGAFYDPISGVFVLNGLEKNEAENHIAILSAGTSDLFVVNEVLHTLTFLGYNPKVIQDIGVSGIHRLLSKVDELKKYKVLIIVAGFEGALPTVVGGLLPQPIIAIPTSVGYGVSQGGNVALNTMLSSCANGITVVNIDNGYGAAMAAVRIINTFCVK